MNLLGCFKIVPDLDILAEQDFIADDDLLVDVRFVRTIWNCFDESALEMMLKLSDSSESLDIYFRLQALTIGKTACNSYLKTLYALGYEKAVRIECEEDLRFRPERTAGLIAGYVSQKGGQDVIIMGRESSDGDNAKTPLLTAEYLGWPCISQVIEIKPEDDTHLRVKSEVDDGILTQIIKCPCVLSVGNAPGSYLRVPTLKDRMKSSKKPIETIMADEIKCACEEHTLETTKLTSLEYVDNSREGVLIKGETPTEKADVLYQLYLKGRLNKG